MTDNCWYFDKIPFDDKETIPDVLSYGIKQGKFLTNDYTMQIMALDEKNKMPKALDENYKKNYCFIPKKTEYYILMWDFDLKIESLNKIHANTPFCTNEELNNYIINFDAVVFKIINLIIKSLKKIFVEPDIKYIIADKNIGLGYHMYFPNIIVNKLVHSYIFNDVLNSLSSLNKYHKEIIKHIFDACVSNANGLR
jgi:hypothetical protein